MLRARWPLRNKQARIGFAAFACALLLSGCRHAPDTASQLNAAAKLCSQGTRPGEQLIAAYPTTVEFVRAWSIGPSSRPAEKAWPSARTSDMAAWCWVNKTDRAEQVVSAAGPDGTLIPFVNRSPAMAPPPARGNP